MVLHVRTIQCGFCFFIQNMKVFTIKNTEYIYRQKSREECKTKTGCWHVELTRLLITYHAGLIKNTSLIFPKRVVHLVVAHAHAIFG